MDLATVLAMIEALKAEGGQDTSVFPINIENGAEYEKKHLNSRHPIAEEDEHKLEELESVLYNRVNPDDFIMQGGGENPNDYNRRKKSARFKGELGSALWRLVGAVFRIPPSRPKSMTSRWKEFLKNVDGCRSTMNRFMKQRLFEIFGFGAAVILVDRPRGEDGMVVETTSKGFAPAVDTREMKDDDLLLVPFKLRQVMDWDHDDCGELNWIRLHQKRRRSIAGGVSVDLDVYREYDRTAWRIFHAFEAEDDEGMKKRIVQLVGMGEHGLGMVPVAIASFDDEGPMQFVSPAQYAVPHDIQKYISDSDRSYNSWKHGHPTLKHHTSRPGTTALPVGPHAKIDLNPDYNEDANYLDFPKEVIDVHKEQSEDSSAGVRRTLGIDSLSGSSDSQALGASGLSRVVSFSISEERILTQGAEACESCENRIMEIGERWRTTEGKELPGPRESVSDHVVTYPKAFSKDAAQDLIAQWKETRSDINSDSYDRAFQRRIFWATLGDLPEEERDKILTEIEDNPIIKSEEAEPGLDEEDRLEEPDLNAEAGDIADAISERDLEELSPSEVAK